MAKDRVLTMVEAMDYLKIKSRSTFYKLLKEQRIQCINLNTTGSYVIRRFTQSALDEYLRKANRATDTLQKAENK